MDYVSNKHDDVRGVIISLQPLSQPKLLSCRTEWRQQKHTYNHLAVEERATEKALMQGLQPSNDGYWTHTVPWEEILPQCTWPDP